MATDTSKMCFVLSNKTDNIATFLGVALVNEHTIKFHKMGIPQHRSSQPHEVNELNEKFVPLKTKGNSVKVSESFKS